MREMVRCNMLRGPGAQPAAASSRRASRTGASAHRVRSRNMDRVMQQNSLVARILAVLKDVAPEADLDRLDPRHSFRDQFDLDSVDYLNFVMALEAAFAIRIPDADYPKLSTLAGCVAYLERATADSAPAAAVAS